MTCIHALLKSADKTIVVRHLFSQGVRRWLFLVSFSWKPRILFLKQYLKFDFWQSELWFKNLTHICVSAQENTFWKSWSIETFRVEICIKKSFIVWNDRCAQHAVRIPWSVRKYAYSSWSFHSSSFTFLSLAFILNHSNNTRSFPGAQQRNRHPGHSRSVRDSSNCSLVLLERPTDQMGRKIFWDIISVHISSGTKSVRS